MARLANVASTEAAEPSRYLFVPCGSCRGCRQSHAYQWVVRCRLELREHECAAVVTLTYDDAYLPPTLRKADLSGYLKRLRASVHPRRVRFFACGEYGEQFGRPHYHAILFGLHPVRDRTVMESAWQVRGLVYVDPDPVGMDAIAYVAGYCAKKLDDPMDRRPWVEFGRYEQLNRETGEVTAGVHHNVFYQPPFLLMSRGGRQGVGIGGKSAKRYAREFRDTFHLDGDVVPAGRYLHGFFKAQATEAELEQLRAERDAFNARPRERTLREEYRAKATIAEARHRSNAERRRLG